MTVARLCSSHKLSSESKQVLKDLTEKYALEIQTKLKIAEDRASLFGNDIATIAFQLKKLHLSKMPELFIFIEQILVSNLDKIDYSCLILMI